MIVTPIAAFLAGALLSLLLPAGLLSVLALWYLLVIRRVPTSANEPQDVNAPAPDAAIEPPSEAR